MATKAEKDAELKRRAGLTQDERDAEDLLKKGGKKDDEGEMVEVSREDLNKLLEKLDRQAKDIDILYKASDKSKMAKALGNGGEILIKKVNLWTWDNTGKIVMATELKTNKCEVVMGKWYEDQNVTVVLEDGETMTVPYIEFSRKILNKIPAEIISTKKETDDKTRKETIIYKVQLDNGKTLEINSSFVN